MKEFDDETLVIRDHIIMEEMNKICIQLDVNFDNEILSKFILIFFTVGKNSITLPFLDEFFT